MDRNQALTILGRDAKAFHYVFLPRVLFLILGGVAAFLYIETIGAAVSDSLFSATKSIGRFLPAFLAVTIASIVMGAVLIGLLIAHLHKSSGLLAEELRHLTEGAGSHESLVSTDPSALFQHLVDKCKQLGFRQAKIIPGKELLAVRMQLCGFGSLDVIEVRPGPESSFVVVARPLLPCRAPRERYKKILEQLSS